MSWFDTSKHFVADQIDFDSPDVKVSRKFMNVFFLNRLEKARKLARVPFKISSGFRTKEHNKKVGGVNGSAHMKGRAADIIASDARMKYKIVGLLLKAGFTRIGIASSFIHVDDDPQKNPGRIWTY